ncbi:321_t:CDS:2 [Ambispora gerdemannii]|uniref:321_t:CDS:1 n=1 Tax=Ambispora gerdemannii TaxID=144530 RepID=A0A9N8ZJ78_9GLOM|nr:321_t:CDS:2 [Ambispora gerdemannii]
MSIEINNRDKTLRLLSPPRYTRPYQNYSYPTTATANTSMHSTPPAFGINDNCVARQSILNNDLKLSRTSCFQMLLDFRESEMDCDVDELPCHLEEYDLEMYQQQQQMRKERTERTTHLPYTMGYRADCEKCRHHVPGHYAHLIGKQQ